MVYEETNLNPFLGEDDDMGGVEELLDDEGDEAEGDENDNIEENLGDGDEEDTSL
jgi:hypothetical protein